MTYPPQNQYPPMSRGQKILATLAGILIAAGILGCLIYGG